jgi:hypothetical protein
VNECKPLDLGKAFTEAPPWTLDDVFPDTNCRTPIIFILSTGADPTAMLQRFATKMGWTPGERLHICSLGRVVQVDPIQFVLIAPGTIRLKLEYDNLPSSFAFKFNLRRYSWVRARAPWRRRWCRADSAAATGCACRTAT